MLGQETGHAGVQPVLSCSVGMLQWSFVQDHHHRLWFCATCVGTAMFEVGPGACWHVFWKDSLPGSVYDPAPK